MQIVHSRHEMFLNLQEVGSSRIITEITLALPVSKISLPSYSDRWPSHAHRNNLSHAPTLTASAPLSSTIPTYWPRQISFISGKSWFSPVLASGFHTVQALALGVTGLEADCHLVDKPTLRSLYFDALLAILENQNAGERVMSCAAIDGVWDVDPSQTLILMTDLKTAGPSTLQAVQQQLAPFRERVTHVSSGYTLPTSVLNSTLSNCTYRDVFFDAPLHDLSSIYDASNYYYASICLRRQRQDSHLRIVESADDGRQATG
ncbi:hypothetical protein WAI453_010313 [Rhynchosporium graminicola]